MTMKTGNTRQRNSLGKASREQILVASEKILKNDGFHSLSTRRVADACGISVGNLTYHFPNKAFLVEAVMLAVCTRYEQQRSAIRLTDAIDPGDYLQNVTCWMLNDAVHSDTSALFLELWVLAKHHDFGTKILERFYATAIGWLVESLGTYFPVVSADKRQRAAYFLLTLSEGSVAVFSRDYSRPVNQKDLVPFAVTAILTILGEETSNSGSK